MGLLAEHRDRPDAELVQLVLAGDEELFGVLVERYRTEFSRYAAGLCGDGDLAADALQEAFIRAFRSLATCRDPKRFKAWFFRILTNQCHNLRDRRQMHVPLEATTVESDLRADDGITKAEIHGAIDTALQELTIEQREAFVLKHVDGYSYAEMAELLDEGVDALKMRVYRAREVVKRRIDELL